MKTIKQQLFDELLQKTRKIPESNSTAGTIKDWGVSEKAPQSVCDELLQNLLTRYKGAFPKSRSLFDSEIGGEPQIESVQQADLSFLDNVANTMVQHPDVTDLVVTTLSKSSEM